MGCGDFVHAGQYIRKPTSGNLDLPAVRMADRLRLAMQAGGFPLPAIRLRASRYNGTRRNPSLSLRTDLRIAIVCRMDSPAQIVRHVMPGTANRRTVAETATLPPEYTDEMEKSPCRAMNAGIRHSVGCPCGLFVWARVG